MSESSLNHPPVITCEGCSNDFNHNDRSARRLECGHTFCCLCLEAVWNAERTGLRCLKCGCLSPATGSLNESLEEDEVLMKIADFNRLKLNPQDVLCAVCPSDSQAAALCFQCQQYLCRACTLSHTKISVTQTHNVVPLIECVNRPEEFFHPIRTCKHHVNEELNLFCEQCSEAVCRTCCVATHATHPVSLINELLTDERIKVSDAVEATSLPIANCNSYIERLVQQNVVLEAKQNELLHSIDTVYQETVQKLSARFRELRDGVISNISEQKSTRNNRIHMTLQKASAIAAHASYCQLAMSFGEDSQFVKISQKCVPKITSLTRTVNLPRISIQNTPLNLDMFYELNRILDLASAESYLSRAAVCIDVTDAITGANCNVMKVTFLPVSNSYENQRTVLEAAVVSPGSAEQIILPQIATVCSTAGVLRFKPDAPGGHKIIVRFRGREFLPDGVVFQSCESREELARKIVFSFPGETRICREILLPRVLLNTDMLNWNNCSVNIYGDLVNTPSPTYPSRLNRLKGATAKTALPGRCCCYWQVRILTKTLSTVALGFSAVDVGICQEMKCDDDIQLADNKYAHCLTLGSCEEHQSMCLYVYSRSLCLRHIDMTALNNEAEMEADFGFLMDFEKRVLSIMHIQSNKVIYSLPDIPTSQALIPVFGVYSPSMFQVRVRVISHIDWSPEPRLLHLLSSLIQTETSRPDS